MGAYHLVENRHNFALYYFRLPQQILSHLIDEMVYVNIERPTMSSSVTFIKVLLGGEELMLEVVASDSVVPYPCYVVVEEL